VFGQVTFCPVRVPRRAGREGDAGPVAEPGLSFAGLLRQLRGETRMTQEELAEAAGVSPRSVSDLERGITRTAHKDTAQLLAGALGLAEPVKERFVMAARGRVPAAEVLAARQGQAPGAFAAAATRALPRDTASFTGRQAELAHLMGALATAAAGGGVVGIHAIDGMAGIGKTTFAVHAAHRLTGSFPDGQFFLPLHAHTAGQRSVNPADALASLLLTAGVPAAQIPPDLEARAGRWRDHVAGKKILLLLDDAAGHEQVTPLLPGTAGSLVLVTSRRRLAALDDAAVISLGTLPAQEAAVLLARLAARPGLRAGDAVVGELTGLCGYLPLAIGMVASQLRHHPAWTAAQLAADLAAAKDRLELMRAENLSVAAAFGLSYQDLTPGAQRLFRRLGLVPGPSVDGHAAAALDATTLGQARRRLGELYDQHLITEPAPGRYQLHDLLREHARTLAAADPAGADSTVERLLDYYARTALAAGQHFRSWPEHRSLPPPGPLAHHPGFTTLEQAAAWLETERPNLHAAADYAAATGRHGLAIKIPAAIGGFLLAHGHVDQSQTLHQTALAAARQAEDQAGQAIALSELGLLASRIGDFPAAAARLTEAAALFGGLDDRPGQASALAQLGFAQTLTGDYPAATASLRHAIALARSASAHLAEADARTCLGVVQQLTGDHTAATANLQQALALARTAGDRLAEADVLNSLGVVQQETGDYPGAAASQQRALEIARRLDDRPSQAYALNDLGIVQQLTGDYPAATASHQLALELFRDHGNRLGQAEALNRLGELSSRTSATAQARQRHAQALAIARDISVPAEEARALEGIGNSHLHDGNPGRAAEFLRQALAIYQRIGAPDAQRVRETLEHHELAFVTAESPPTTARGQGRQPPTPATPSRSQ
jgi:tetratricopeptide (TPR) repeat protein/transcriptional regulator with XRE-family HTH domain